LGVVWIFIRDLCWIFQVLIVHFFYYFQMAGITHIQLNFDESLLQEVTRQQACCRSFYLRSFRRRVHGIPENFRVVGDLLHSLEIRYNLPELMILHGGDWFDEAAPIEEIKNVNIVYE